MTGGVPPLTTDQLIEAVNAVQAAGGNKTAAAKALGVPRETLRCRLKRAALRGYSPEHDMTRTVPEGFLVKGVSTYYDKEGKPRGQWVKSALDHEHAEEIVREFVDSLAADVRGLSPLVPPPEHADADLLTVYPMGDPHFGMYAWAAETGDDFDVDIAESVTRGAIDRLVSSAPASKTGLLLNLGDFLHADNATNRTPESGHVLDVDTRHPRVLQIALRCMVHCIDRLKQRHEKVLVWFMPGNHDPNVSFALALCLDAYFSNDARVEVDLSPGLYKYLRFGRVLLGAHHGHGAKFSELPGIMATDRHVDWGRTKHRYWYCGHIHHVTRDKEHPGCVVETFRTLAPRDAWHAGKGYRAGRDMLAITHHRDHGEVMRTRCDISMLRKKQKK